MKRRMWPKISSPPQNFCLSHLKTAKHTASSAALSAMLLTILTIIPRPANATSDYRYGVAVGYGGEGLVTTATTTTGQTEQVTRSDEPLMLEIFLDKYLSDNFLLSFSHSRGVSVSPLTSGISFTGISGIWYLLGPVSAVTADSGSSIFVKRWAPFAGVSTGFAQAVLTRPGDPVPTVNGSGAFLGIRLGFDVPTSPGHGIRPELVYSSTSYLQSFAAPAATTPPVLTQFSLQCGWYFDF